MRRETMCIQAGYEPKNGESRMIPIIQSTTFKYDTSEAMGKLFDLQESGYFYTRLQNPTNDMVAAKIAALEGGTAAMLTSSGQAASFFSVFNIAGAGDHIVASATIYGGTFNLFNVTMKRMGIEFTFVDPDCTDEELEAAKTYCSANGIRLSGKNAYPHFMKFAPGYFPWHPQPGQDESYLIQAVQACMDLKEIIGRKKPEEISRISYIQFFKKGSSFITDALN